MNANHPDAPLRASLKDRPVLSLTLRDRDYGAPCPEDRWYVKGAIDDLLKPAQEGMVLDLDVLDTPEGDADDILVIGVVDLASALPKLRDLFKRLNIPAGAILVVDGSEENLIPDLPSRAELVRQATDSMIQMVLAESIACAPADWESGTLTIQCDGNWLGYKLKNAKSRNSASISGDLKSLCEELAVLMWKNGNEWREAVLAYEGKRFTIAFSYEEPREPIPRTPAPTPAPAPAAPWPWWKLW